MDEFLLENPIKQYPPIYRFKEVKAIADAQLNLYKELDNTLNEIDRNSDFKTADETTIARYEKMVDIQPIDTESLEFRRARIENRFNLNKKYVMLYYCEKLNELIGYKKWKATINAKRTQLLIEANAQDAHWYKELVTTLNMIKPVRLLLTIKLKINEKLLINTKTTKQKVNYTFIVGSSRVGIDKLGIKTGEINNIGGFMTTDEQIKRFATEIKSKAKSVLVNNEHIINSFSIKLAKDNTAILEYVIPSYVEHIDNVKIISDDGVIAEANVNIINADNVAIQHTFTIEAIEAQEDKYNEQI